MCNKSDFPFFPLLLLPFSRPSDVTLWGEKGWTKAVGPLLVYLAGLSVQVLT